MSDLLVPIPKSAIAIRPGTIADVPFLDSLQKVHSKQLGYFPTKQFEGYIAMGAVLVAESSGKAVGYCISRDRYLKRDELGVIYQLCVAPGAQRKLIGAELVREVFARSAYGCRLYCCWCAKDLEANYFWESMGFVPIAFRAGSSKKARVHIFWQKRIVDGDTETKWWYPSKTDQGAIREDRLVFPIPPGVSWKDVEAVAMPEETHKPQLTNHKEAPNGKKEKAPKAVVQKTVGFGFLSFTPPKRVKEAKQKKEKLPKVKKKVDPKLIAAARELRDRWLEKVNAEPSLLSSDGKYDVMRALGSQVRDETPTRGLLPLAA